LIILIQLTHSDTGNIFEGCNELIYLKTLSKNNANNLNVNNTNQKIKQLNEEIKKLKREINDTIAINFFSVSQNINYPIACKITDNFKVLEERLYQDYPELKHKNLNFMANGSVINKFETLENNRIKNGDAILIDEQIN